MIVYLRSLSPLLTNNHLFYPSQMSLDFSLSNPLISNYFDGDDSYIPVSELLYLHTHPLVQPNFLSDIEKLINDTAVYLESKNMRGTVVEQIVTLTIEMSSYLPSLDRENAPKFLETLRRIYSICVGLIGKPVFQGR